MASPAPQRVTVALDWAPNSNHVGLMVAKAKGWFAQANLEVIFVKPKDVATALASGEADFGVVSALTLAHSHATGGCPLKALATVQQKQTSALVSLRCTSAEAIATYAAYGETWEREVVNAMRRAKCSTALPAVAHASDGGDSWAALLAGQADAAWIFLGWEGVDAQAKGIKLHAFKPDDLGIPYPPGPLLAARAARLEGDAAETARAFLAAATRGYAFACTQPEEASRLLVAEAKECGFHVELGLLAASMAYLASERALVDAQGVWGGHQPQAVQAFVDWLASAGLVSAPLKAEAMLAHLELATPGWDR